MTGLVPSVASSTHVNPTAGAAVESAQAAAFTCQGRVVKTPPKSARKVEESKPVESDVRTPESYLAWSCRTQSVAQKALNGLYIPAPDGGPVALEDAMRQSARINQAVGLAMDKNCSCSFEPHNAKTKKPLVACSCTGSYQAPKSRER